MNLVTLGNIAYSYFQNTRLGPYAYAIALQTGLLVTSDPWDDGTPTDKKECLY